MNAGSKAFRRPRQQPATNRSIRENPHAVSAVQIRDRIKELRRVRASELVPNPKNWRRHPQSQIVALRAVLNQVGYADALLARELPDGKLLLIDGHLRAETTPQVLVPVLVLDLNEQEADLVMATLDPLTAMAQSDSQQLKALLATLKSESATVQELLEHVAGPRLLEALYPTQINQAEVSPERADVEPFNKPERHRELSAAVVEPRTFIAAGRYSALA